MAYNIDKQKIINYLKENKIFFQKTDELIETIDELQSQTHNGLITLVKNSSINVIAYFGDTHPGISVISTQFVSYKMAFGCKFIISFLNSHLLSQNDAKSVQFCPGSHQQ